MKNIIATLITTLSFSSFAADFQVKSISSEMADIKKVSYKVSMKCTMTDYGPMADEWVCPLGKVKENIEKKHKYLLKLVEDGRQEEIVKPKQLKNVTLEVTAITID